ncbi:flagellar biosynthesis protein FlhB [Virgisporangium ochraceum]|uniref:Flagellar biosynthesis protein FlhB n=1 Tax=Virgisporangium ochraceum TaxID=65505 RepID=A0A8J4ECP2_9ACTN|nr:EscU/YscU/HrcU family type III secretion system export apparatus switch protein [Virgisporangium ochraceum]GIJ69849.1 flagellar biosynthesis protein FlhB [Virgisporangium ochraceum]
MSGEKTEKPTAQRKKKAISEGQIARTPDLGAWAGMLLASFLVPMALEDMMNSATEIFRRGVGIAEDPNIERAQELFQTGMTEAGKALLPLGVGLMVLGLVAGAAQGGIHFPAKMFMPKFNRLNPFPGIKRAFGGHAAWEAVKTTVKTAVLGLVLYFGIKDLVPAVIAHGSLPLKSLLQLVVDTAVGLMRYAAAAGLVMAAADYAMARRRINKQIYMSKEEIKQEHKNTEGDPHLKGAIRAKQIAMARNRMMSNLPQADVVMVNPTHVAVALAYDQALGAPRVIAKGAGAVAAKIREKATELRIPLVQNHELARTLYKTVELGQEIPPELYVAVARVLAFVMSLKAKGAAAGLHRQPVV